MKKRKLVFVAVAIASLLILAGAVLAHGRGSGFEMDSSHHNEMEDIMEEGTYSDLVELREDYGVNMMPWVNNEETFEEAQERHVTMEEFHKEYGSRMHRSKMMGGFSGHGCHSR